MKRNGHHFTKVIRKKGTSSCIHCSMTKDYYQRTGEEKICQRPAEEVETVYFKKPQAAQRRAYGRNCKMPKCSLYRKHTHSIYGSVMIL